MAIDSAQVRRFLGHSAKTGGDPSLQHSTILRRWRKLFQRTFLRFFTLHHPSFLTVHAFTLLFVLASSGCQKNPVVPPDRLLPDTTSHDFTWKIDTLGDGGSSVLYDVAIINDTLAYAVGEIYLKDSTGQIDPNAYNLAQWNGSSWTLHRIEFYTICGQASRTSYPTSAIWAFGPSDVWIAMDGDQIARWNGSSQISTECLPLSFSVKKMWADNPSSVYAVGSAGTIMHFDGSQWQKIETPSLTGQGGTTLPIQDIWGGTNPKTGQQEILAVAGSIDQTGKAILRIEGTAVSSVSDSGLYWSLSGVWFDPGKAYYAVGNGVGFKGDVLDEGPWSLIQDPEVTGYFIYSVRGNNANDVMVAGAYGAISHYNGSSWRSYLGQTQIEGNYYRVIIKGDLTLAVGQIPGRAVAAVGTRAP